MPIKLRTEQCALLRVSELKEHRYFDDLLLIIPYQITQNPEIRLRYPSQGESKHPKSPDRINFLIVLLVTFDILLENEEYSLGCLCK